MQEVTVVNSVDGDDHSQDDHDDTYASEDIKNGAPSTLWSQIIDWHDIADERWRDDGGSGYMMSCNLVL